MQLDVVSLTVGFLLVFGVVALVTAARTARGTSEDMVRRIQGTPALSREAAALQDQRVGAELGRQLGAVARLTGAGDADVSQLRRQLTWAGYRREHSVQIFLASKVLLAVGALVGFAFLNAMRAEPIPMAVPLAIAALGTFFFLPNLWLRSRIASRQKSIERGLPDTLDLLVTCVEAGLGLDAAFQRVANEMALACPVLADEFQLTMLEVKAGIPRIEAMRRMAERTGVSDLRSLSATLNQTEMFGTSIAAALRVQAEGMRIRRTQSAEERAAFLAVKMTLPLAFFLLPSLLAVIIGPAAVSIMTTFLKK